MNGVTLAPKVYLEVSRTITNLTPAVLSYIYGNVAKFAVTHIIVTLSFIQQRKGCVQGNKKKHRLLDTYAH